MTTTSNLTGRWIGYYEQEGQRRPIVADLVQEGVALGGSMHDGQSDFDCSLFDLTAKAGLPPGADERIDANLRAMMPGARGPIRYVIDLPPESRLEGRCAGSTVSFVKTYLGESFQGYKVGEKVLGSREKGHSVHYQGLLSLAGDEIQGTWCIPAGPGHQSRRTEGTFLLRRDLEAATSRTETAVREGELCRPGWRSWIARFCSGRGRQTRPPRSPHSGPDSLV
jgi:hypothetical protein